MDTRRIQREELIYRLRVYRAGKLVGMLYDLSPTGMLVRGKNRLMASEAGLFALELPHNVEHLNSAWLELPGRVIRSASRSDGKGTIESGVEFQGLSEESRDIIRTLIDYFARLTDSDTDESNDPYMQKINPEDIIQ